MSRIYAVSESTATANGIVQNRATLVRAENQAQAIRHVVGSRFHAKVASQDELVELVGSGGVVEVAGEDAPEPTGE